MNAGQAQSVPMVSLRARYDRIRTTTLEIAQPFSPEDQMLQSVPEASPMKWHLAHTTWFFETFLLSPNVKGYRAFSPKFRELFNSYYKQLGAHPYRGARGLMSRPSLEEVQAYRQWVDAEMGRPDWVYHRVTDDGTHRNSRLPDSRGCAADRARVLDIPPTQ